MDPIIKLYQTQMQTQLEGEVLRATAAVGVHVDKERLIKALENARSFYDEGYQAGRAAVQDIVRCRDCVYFNLYRCTCSNPLRAGYTISDGFCYNGTRQDD